MTRLASEEDNEANRRGRGSAEKAPTEPEAVRKPLPEPGGDRVGCPKQFHLHRKEKKKIFWQYQMFRFLFWNISIKTQYETEGWNKTNKKKSSYLQPTETIFTLKFLSHSIMKFWANKISVLCTVLVDIL